MAASSGSRSGVDPSGTIRRLKPLLELVETSSEPLQICAALRTAARNGDVAMLLDSIQNRVYGEPVLKEALILDDDRNIRLEAEDQLIRLEAMVYTRAFDADRWQQVVTVPDYLRGALPYGVVDETLSRVVAIVKNAERDVIVASPYLDDGFNRLSGELSKLMGQDVRVEILTRNLREPTSTNSAVIRKLRDGCPASKDNLRVVSWDGYELGLHMKAVVVDSRVAYVGSANFTHGGFGRHAELGALLTGESVEKISNTLRTLMTEIKKRK